MVNRAKLRNREPLGRKLVLSAPRGAHNSYQCIQIDRQLIPIMSAYGKFVRRIGDLRRTILGLFLVCYNIIPPNDALVRFIQFLPLDEAIASRAVFVIVSGSDGRTDGNAFGAS